MTCAKRLAYELDDTIKNDKKLYEIENSLGLIYSYGVYEDLETYENEVENNKWLDEERI